MKRFRMYATWALCALMGVGYAVTFTIVGVFLVCLAGAMLADIGGNPHFMHILWAWWGDKSFDKVAELAGMGAATMVLYPLALILAPENCRQGVRVFNPADLLLF